MGAPVLWAVTVVELVKVTQLVSCGMAVPLSFVLNPPNKTKAFAPTDEMVAVLDCAPLAIVMVPV